MDTIKFYMRVPLPDGSHTDGKIDYTKVPDQLGISDLDLSGQRVLDIAANDGFWTFWAEKQGAADLLAIDVDSFDGYDWSYDGPPKEFRPDLKNTASQGAEAGAGFEALRKLFRSKAVRKNLSIYDLDPIKHGKFDLIFNFGLLYHLRHPLLSLEKCRRVCQGAMILETHVVNGFGNLPVNLFYNRDELHTITNWTGPTFGCVVQWLHSAGFPRIFSNKTNSQSPYSRNIFIACIDDKYASRFEGNSDLVEYDQAWLDKSRNETRNFLTGKWAFERRNM